ncbi:MAG: response regulator transcription factor [Chloroflexi bacterium]|nr:response regulator transcription factor [Chloroflexota bacterium]
MREALLVGRDEESAGYLARALGESEFRCEYVSTVEALNSVALATPDIVILDLPLLDNDSIALCRRLREISTVPLVVCSMSNQELDVVKAFEAGADDYLVIPMRPAEMTARIQALLRRTSAAEPVADDSDLIRAGDLEVHLADHRVYRDGELIDLSPIEFRLLVSLIRQQGRAVSHTKLLSSVWGPEYVDCRHYLRLYIKYLRSKIERDPRAPELILNEWGVGYRFEPPLPAGD